MKQFPASRRRKSKSLNTHYTLFAAIISAIIAAAAVVSYVAIYNLTLSKLTDETKNKSKIFASYLELVLEAHTQKAELIAQNISETDAQSKHLILSEFDNEVLLDSSLEKANSSHSSAIFSWINLDGYIVMSSYDGILDNAYAFPRPEMLKEAKEMPMTIHFGEPVVDTNANIETISSVTAVTSSENILLGYLLSTIESERLLSELSSIISTNELHASIYYNNGTPLQNQKTKEHMHNVLKSDMPKYPFYLEVSINNRFFKENLDRNLRPIMFILIGLGLLFLVVLFFFQRLLIKPIMGLSKFVDSITVSKSNIAVPKGNNYEIMNLGNALEKLKQKIDAENSQKIQLQKELEKTNQSRIAYEGYVTKIHQEMRKPVRSITSKLFQAKLYADNRQHEKLYKEITSLIGMVEQIDNQVVSLFAISQVNPNKVINNCIQTIYFKSTVLNKIPVNFTNGENLADFYTDELCFKKIILSLINRSLEFIDADGKIDVSVKSEELDERKWLVVKISDDGFGLDEASRERIINKYVMPQDSREMMLFDLRSIGMLVKMLQGELLINSQLNDGCQMVVKLPYLNHDEFKMFSDHRVISDEKGSNVVSFKSVFQKEDQ